MRALTYQGRRDVRVETVPDPRIQDPTDIIVRITSSGFCGSDLHLCEVLGPCLGPGDILGHEPMGVVEEVGPDVNAVTPGDRVVIPFNVSCGHCHMCGQGLHSQCETTQVRERGMGASLFGFTKLYGQVPGGQAEYLRVPFGNALPIKVPDGPPDDRFVFLSDVPPTAWQAVEYADIPPGGSVTVLGLGPIGAMAARIALHRGVGLVIGVGLVPERLDRVSGYGATCLDLRLYARGQGGAHGGRAAARRSRAAPDGDGGRRPPRRSAHGDRPGAQGRHDLRLRRVRRLRRPDADAHPVRQADPAPHGPGQRQTLGGRPSAPAHRRRPARRGLVRHPPPAARRGASGVRHVPEERRRHDQDSAHPLT
ncbi:Putative dehydrogenase [Streptomyces globisporus]|uniref:Dehydrogenase n=1 Tax=Streptomyces globisporus TaxID=1908 RepID=A0ABN8VDS5_STRGL|nr:Putative dehydrogenase [Streptomyces globisporus]